MQEPRARRPRTASQVLLPLLAGLALLIGLVPATPLVAHAEFDVYTTPGTHTVNGRQWRTTCEPYSQTKRCRTEIWATQVSQTGDRFVQTNGWVFNNLTYAASARSLWKSNTLAANGVVGGKVSWTAADGRKWRTECDTATTGRNGCRSYIQARVIESYTSSDGTRQFRWVTKEIFNNLVRFTTAAPVPAPKPTVKPSPKPSPKPSAKPTQTPTAEPSPEPTLPPGTIDPASIVDPALRECISSEVGISVGEPIPKEELKWVFFLDCDWVGSLRGMPELPNLETLMLQFSSFPDLTEMPNLPKLDVLNLNFASGLSSLEGMPVFPMLHRLAVRWSSLSSFNGMPVQPNLQIVEVDSSEVRDFRGMPVLPALVTLELWG